MEEKICSVCGKAFIKAAQHLYKRRVPGTHRHVYQCSYSCYLKEGKRCES